MTEHYVTLIDSLFLPQAIALAASLERVARPYTLWIVCVDADAYRVIAGLARPNVQPLGLDTVETEGLRAVRATRTREEYCWTLTPFCPDAVFARASTDRVTYLDADMWLRRAPGAVFAELEASGKSALITGHAFAPECDFSADSGVYCVQWNTFVRGRSDALRREWQTQCLDWCYRRPEDRRFGDQKYLDDWPERHGDVVHVLRDERLMLAPWNATRFPYNTAVAYHFQGLRVQARSVVFGTSYALPPPLVTNVYQPYVADLRTALAVLRDLGWTAPPQPVWRDDRSRLMRLARAVYRNRWRFRFRHEVRL